MADATCCLCGWNGQKTRVCFLNEGGSALYVCEDSAECADLSARRLWMDAEEERMRVQDAYERGIPLW